MNSMTQSSSTPQADPFMQGEYTNHYATALGLNTQNYQNMLSQYQQGTGAVGSAVNAAQAGYGALSNLVQGTISGIGGAQSQAIKDQLAQASGGMQQQLINKGLGNTTVAQTMQRGLTLDSQKAQIALADQIAQLKGGYLAQLGGAGVQAGLQGAQLLSGMGNNLIGALASYRTPYPGYPPVGQRGTSTTSSGGVPGMGGGSGGGQNSITRPFDNGPNPGLPNNYTQNPNNMGAYQQYNPQSNDQVNPQGQMGPSMPDSYNVGADQSLDGSVGGTPEAQGGMLNPDQSLGTDINYGGDQNV